MNNEELSVFTDLAEVYRILREAYHHDIHREAPALNDLQLRVREMIAKHPQSSKLRRAAIEAVRDYDAHRKDSQRPSMEALRSALFTEL